MRIIRQVAPNTRLALRAVRERLGENAIILSSCRTSEGVEVTAGADVEAAELPPECVPTELASAEPPPQPPSAVAIEPSVPAIEVGDAMPNPGVQQELQSLRHMLETQLAQLAWSDLTRRLPVQAELLRELTEIGLAPDLAQRIADQLPQDSDPTYARRFAFTALAQYLPVTGERWTDSGGRLAFIGLTGVGKTTCLA